MSFLNLFNRKSKNLVSVDIHSHLIPGIDDGAKDMERAISLILSLKEMGYKKLITTPHISDMFLNDSQKITEGYNLLIQELSHRNIDIEIEVAAEYYIDEHFEKLLKKRDILTFGKEKYLLFELSYFTPPKNLESLVYEMQQMGYTPILAHPERYEYFHNSMEHYFNLKKVGLLFQINLNSIVNYYNDSVKKCVKSLIAHGLVDFVGTDTHHRGHINFLNKSFSNTLYKQIFKKNTILNDTLF
jgi:tyrosine-protein phosphatase YwqE